MAGHYMSCAAELEFDRQASKKLVLMCIADDADKQSRIGRVGLDAIQRWSGLRKSRALEVIAELVAEGYLVRHAAGRIGRQAEFVVFPGGCCPLHGPVPGYVPPGQEDTEEEQSAIEEVTDPGSGPPDPGEGGGASGPPDPASEVEGPEEGPVQGPVAAGPPKEKLFIKNPPNPPANRGATSHCRRHRTRPGPNCRRCGTSPRGEDRRLHLEQARAAAAAVERIERDRDALPPCGHPDCDADTRWRSPDDGPARRCPDCNPDVVIGRPTAEQLDLARQLPALSAAHR